MALANSPGKTAPKICDGVMPTGRLLLQLPVAMAPLLLLKLLQLLHQHPRPQLLLLRQPLKLPLLLLLQHVHQQLPPK